MAQLLVRLPDRNEVVGSNPGWSVLFFFAENIPVLSGRLVLTCFVLPLLQTDTKGACAVSQIGVHAGMLAVVGCLLNEIVFLLKEVTPSLWKKQYFPLIYFLNTVALPGTPALTTNQSLLIIERTLYTTRQNSLDRSTRCAHNLSAESAQNFLDDVTTLHCSN